MKCDSCSQDKLVTMEIIYRNLNREVVGFIEIEWCANEKCIDKLNQEIKKHMGLFAAEIERQKQQSINNLNVKGEFDPSDLT